ncbi:hypothetical protein CSB08_00020 [Candidatus Gracilibacteria bacterium]|nr:MAG: hypothetical protein CSB08_00020 [Candidatus Gracilibacteria bacterium]PIE85707.1 MAG: hypothetical protein CSA08_00720 [Candidatus Gracilibacteria bacterium]
MENKGNNIKYINIIAQNDVGVLNRIANLIRKRNYNIDDMNLTFDNEGKAHFLVGFHSEKVEIDQIMNQLSKLYDVIDIEKIEDLVRIKKNYYVYSKDKNDFDNFSEKPIKVVEITNTFVAIFLLDFYTDLKFKKELDKSGLKYLYKSI